MKPNRITNLTLAALTLTTLSYGSPLQGPGDVVSEESVLADFGLPSIWIGTRGVYARPFADVALIHEQETNPAAEGRRELALGEPQPGRVAERLTLSLDVGADGYHDGWCSELLGIGLGVGGRNASWDGDLFEPIAAAESSISLRLGGQSLITFEAEKELAIGTTLERQLASKRKQFKLGPVRINVESKVYAAMGLELGGTVLFSAPGGPPGSDLGIGASLKALAGGGASGKVWAGSRGFRVGGSASVSLLDAVDQFTLTARESGVDAQLRLKVEALSAYLRVWASAWFFRASRTLVNWRLAGFERVFDLF